MVPHNESRTEKRKDESTMAWKTTRNGSMGVLLWSNAGDQKFTQEPEFQETVWKACPFASEGVQSWTTCSKLGHYMFSLSPNFLDRATKTQRGMATCLGSPASQLGAVESQIQGCRLQGPGFLPLVGSCLHLPLVGDPGHLRGGRQWPE